MNACMNVGVHTQTRTHRIKVAEASPKPETLNPKPNQSCRGKPFAPQVSSPRQCSASLQRCTYVCALREQETVCICVCGFVRDLRVCLVLALSLSLYSGNTEDEPVKDQSCCQGSKLLSSFAHQSLASLGHSKECSLSAGNKQTLNKSLASNARSPTSALHARVRS